MNFKKYHVSRNLWDNRGFSATTITLNNIHNISNNYGTTLSTTEGDEVTITQSAYPTGNVGYQNGFFMIDVDFSKYAVGDVVTISFDYIVNEVHALSTQTSTTVYAGKNSNTVPAILSSGDWKVSGRLTAVITIIADMNPCVEVRLCGNSITVKNIMLNTGSSPLPYEPYSSEVWHDIPHYVHKTATDTITALPAVLYPTGATATVGLKGQTVQSSIPSPTSPIMPEGTGDRTGNLFDKTTLENGIYLAANGNKYGNVTNGVRAGAKIKAFSNTAYTFSVQSSANVSLRIFEWSNGTFIKQTPKYNVSGNASLTVTTDAETTEIAFNIEGENGQYATNIMLNTGSTPLPHENFGYKIPISSANTTTPVYLGEVETTRRVKKLVLTGDEETGFYRKNTTSADNSLYYIRFAALQSVPLNNSPLYCTHLQNINYTPSEVVGINVAATYAVIYFNLGLDVMNAQPSGNTIAGLKEYLAAQYAAGTPVTVWYVLATPEASVVNEPLMKIGDYADEVSGIIIPVTAGGDTISVDTTVQPSEVTVNYKGWHPAIVHERTNGAWT